MRSPASSSTAACSKLWDNSRCCYTLHVPLEHLAATPPARARSSHQKTVVVIVIIILDPLLLVLLVRSHVGPSTKPTDTRAPVKLASAGGIYCQTCIVTGKMMLFVVAPDAVALLAGAHSHLQARQPSGKTAHPPDCAKPTANLACCFPFMSTRSTLRLTS